MIIPALKNHVCVFYQYSREPKKCLYSILRYGFREVTVKIKEVLDKEFSLETISKAFEEAKNKRREISAKICCTTDKSPFKKELLESISDIENSIKLSDENIEKTQCEINELNNKIKIFYENRENWNKKLSLINEKERLSKMQIEIPEKPEEISVTSYSAEKANVIAELNKIKKYKEMQNKYNQFWKNKREYNVVDLVN